MATNVLDCYTPENGKLRVRLLDQEMWTTDKFVQQAHAQGRIDARLYADWNSTMREWNIFANDVLHRSDWAMFSYCDVEENCRTFEREATVVRAAIGAPDIRDVGAEGGSFSDWRPMLYAALAVTALVVVVPKLPSYEDLFGKRKRLR